MLLLLAAFLAQPTSPPSAPVSPPPAEPFRVVERSNGREFVFSFPVEVQNVPALRSRLEGIRDRARIEAEPCVADGDNVCPEVGYQYSHEWQWLGRGGPMASLVGTGYAYAGGAHGNYDFMGMLWDAGAAQEVQIADLFEGARWPERFRPRYCAALNREREEKRGEPVDPNGDEFLSGCPALAQVVALPEDTDANNLFDTLHIFIAPYAAGPYAEGAYEPLIPFTQEDIAAMRPDVRAAFEARR